MARISPVRSREDLPEDQRQHFDEITNRRGEPSEPTLFFLNSPRFGSLYSQLADYLRLQGLLTPSQVRLAGMMVGRFYDAQYIWAVNRGRDDAPISEATLDAIAHRGDVGAQPGEEGVIGRFVGELLEKHLVSDSTFAAARDLLGLQGVLELTGVVSLYTMIANTVKAFEIEPPPDTPRLP